MSIDIEALRELCAMTVELTRLRQAECKQLCIENFAPDVLGKLIREFDGAIYRIEPPPVVGAAYATPKFKIHEWK